MGIFEEESEVGEGYLTSMWYGGPGSGKTYTCLSIATALGPTAIVDTERGSEPYRPVFRNPDGSAFKIARTRSCSDVVDRVIPEALEAGVKCLIIDQISSMWEDRKDQYIYREFQKQSKAWRFIEQNGKLPFQAWSFVKGEYKKMIRALLSAPMHVFIIGRLAEEFEVAPSGEPVKVGERAEAEKNTQHEPSILVRMEYDKKKKKHYAWVEKDRWGCIQGEVFTNPTIEMLKPVLDKLGSIHKPLPEPDVPETVSATCTGAQAKLISVIAKKGGRGEEQIARVLEGLSKEEAAQLINELTLGKFERFDERSR